MASAMDLFKMVRALTRQTELGNIRWTEESQGGDYLWTGTSASVELEAVDLDYSFPIKFSVYDGSGILYGRWVTHAETELGEGKAWDDEVRKLWAVVHKVRDPVSDILKDLEALPPF